MTEEAKEKKTEEEEEKQKEREQETDEEKEQRGFYDYRKPRMLGEPYVPTEAEREEHEKTRSGGSNQRSTTSRTHGLLLYGPRRC